MERKRKNPYDKFNFKSKKAVNSYDLIKEIEKHEILYNREYYNKAEKRKVWDDVNRALFPEFDHFNEKLKQAIRTVVNRRWKTLRDCLVRALKVRQVEPARVETPQMKAMAFLIPYMTHGSKQTVTPGWDPDAIGNDMTIVNVPLDDMQYGSKPSDGDSLSHISYEGHTHDNNYNKSEDDGLTSTDEEMPFRGFATAAGWGEICQQADKANELGVTEIKLEGNEFTHEERIHVLKQETDILQEIENNISVQSEIELPPPEEPVYEIADSPSPKRYCSGKDVVVNSKIFELIQKNAIDSQDEDRMFLLSLLSDFKRVLPENRLKVKMKIVLALADGV